MHRASAIWGLSEKFTSVYLFKIAREKSCDYLLIIIYMKRFRDGYAEEVHAYQAIREKLHHQLRHPGWRLIWKQKIWLAICEFLWSLTNQNAWFVTSFCTCQSFLISTLCTNFVFLHSKNFKFLHCLGLIDMLSANQHGEIFVMYIIRSETPWKHLLCNQGNNQMGLLVLKWEENTFQFMGLPFFKWIRVSN